MIASAQLQAALEAVDGALLSALPEESTCNHVFSDAFERKMKKVFRRAAHPLAHKILVRAACAALILATLFSALVAFNPAVRAAIIGWLRSWMGDFYSYSYQVPARNAAPPKYYLSNLPEGYSYIGAQHSKYQETLIYADTNGEIIRFTWIMGDDISHIFNKGQSFSIHRTTILNNHTADIYISPSKQYNNSIVWLNLDNGYLFYISGHCSESTLVYLAEHVKQLD